MILRDVPVFASVLSLICFFFINSDIILGFIVGFSLCIIFQVTAHFFVSGSLIIVILHQLHKTVQYDYTSLVVSY